MPTTIGFVGLGNMGTPMAERLLNGGFSVVIYDINSAVMDELVSKGAKKSTSLKKVGDDAEIIFISLPTPPIVREVALGKDGLIHGSKVKVIVDLSTTGATTAQIVHDALAPRGIEFVDSPVSGGRGGAIAGTLAVMTSCKEATFAQLEPMLKLIGKPFFIGTKSGMAQTMKLVNNLMSATAMAITSEALGMGVKAGLDPKVMIDVINSGSGLNTASRDKFPRAILPRKFDYGFTTALMYKDVKLCLEEAKSMGVSMTVGDAVHRIWQKTNDEIGADEDFTTVVKLIEKELGIEIKST
jgi:3-hydroxyisobutyrate dehydrogenase-like beta-hydroxyacid dehydrogenase